METLLYFGWGDFNVDDDGSQRCFEELGRVVDGIGIQHDQLKRLCQLKDPLYLALDLSWEQTQQIHNSSIYCWLFLTQESVEVSILSSY